MNRLGTATGRLMTAMPVGTAFGMGSMGMGGGRPPTKVQEGEYTQYVYSLLAEKKYDEVIFILQYQLQFFPDSRAALSLLAYSYYMSQDFINASQTYHSLIKLFPDVEEYRIYYAQSLYKSGSFLDASKACAGIESDEHSQRVQKLQAYIHYEAGDIVATKAHAEKCLQGDPDTMVLQGCILYKEESYEESRKKFQDAQNVLEYQSHVTYNIALCSFRLRQYTAALKTIQEINERGIREHPELSVCSTTDGYEMRSVGNSQTLRETGLVESYNLKCAIEYNLKNYETALDALKDMPPRAEQELDAVTLHNQALLQMDKEATIGFKKMKHLIQNPPFPPETFANLLLLYCKHGYYYLAADILAENDHLSTNYLTPELYDFLEATITAQNSPEEAFRKFDDLASKHIEQLRKHTKVLQDARHHMDKDLMKKALKDYDEALDAYIPVLMSMAKIYWDAEHFVMVEKILMQSIEFCSEHETWKLNMAHVMFMQENKFKEAISYYNPIVSKSKDHLLQVPAMVLANLCVSYIMTSQNEEAEEWMRNIEKEEDRLGGRQEKQSLHLCIVNLVIGTLYCSKGHYEFGISRVMKSLDPLPKKIMTDTWFYSKRCFLSLIENLAKHMITIKDSVVAEIITFLESAQANGRNITTTLAFNAAGASDATNTSSGVILDANDNESDRTVAQEARMLKRMFLKLAE
ncbi:intraflagellar transport protein 70A [Acrasis kona]|uniref:Intraflagellar transport protein 70A n=1 Tax=Acrasis kona TaxID=1008807 RepID=A0AAW2ZA42_9EUKA